MTARTVDEAALLEAIRLQPEEDTPRLALADALDERGDAAGAARAEFIRVQFRNAATQAWLRTREAQQRHPGPVIQAWREQMEREESALRAAHEAEWRAVGVCWACIDGTAPAKAACGHCGGTQDVGGLMERQRAMGGTDVGWTHRVDFRRGFPDVVHATLAEAFHQPLYNEGHDTEAYGHWQPTPWARRVARHHPVSGFRVTDREPMRLGSPAVEGHPYVWHRHDAVYDSQHLISEAVFDIMDGQLGPPELKYYPTAELAHAALGAALVALARG